MLMKRPLFFKVLSKTHWNYTGSCEIHWTLIYKSFSTCFTHNKRNFNLLNLLQNLTANFQNNNCLIPS